MRSSLLFNLFFFNDTATTEISTLSLHDALPILYSLDPLEDPRWAEFVQRHPRASVFHTPGWLEALRRTDRKSTRLNSSHSQISYAVFCLKKKKKTAHTPRRSPAMCRVLDTHTMV